MPTKRDWRDRLVITRKAVGHSQESLDRAIGVKRTTVLCREASEIDPQPYNWPKLAEDLELSAAQLAQVLNNDAAGLPAGDDIATSAVAQATGPPGREQPAQPGNQVGLVPLFGRSPSSPSGAAKLGLTTSAGLAAIEAMAMAFQTADREVGSGRLCQAMGYLNTEVVPLLLGSTGDNIGGRCPPLQRPWSNLSAG